MIRQLTAQEEIKTSVGATLAPPSTRAPEISLVPEDVGRLTDELRRYHAHFTPLFQRKEQRRWALKYMEGQMMIELKSRSIEPMALHLEGGNVQAMQQFISDGSWDDKKVLERHRQLVDETLGEDGGVVTLDSSEFPKQGRHSVGVARQYCGRTGKVDNCQSGVFLGYASGKGYTLVDRRLFLPEKWFDEKYLGRREACKVPEDLVFKTKPQLGAEMIRLLDQEKILRFRWIVGDELFGRSSWLLDQIDEIGRCYMMEVPIDTHVWMERPETCVPRWSGRGRRPGKKRCLAPGAPASCRVDAVAGGLNAEKWKRHTIEEGCKGPVVSEFASVRVVASRDRLPGPDVWLILCRKVGGGVEGAPLRAFLSNAPVETSLDVFVRVWRLRWTVERAFEECKGELGMDEYQVRGWRGWHHHMTMTFLSHHFLVKMRLRLGEKAPALTVPQVREMLNVVLPRREFDEAGVLELVKYRQQRNYAAYRSHCKRQQKG